MSADAADGAAAAAVAPSRLGRMLGGLTTALGRACGAVLDQRLVRSAAIAVLQCGRVPDHVAFIMDGNRRFARRRHMPTQEGHAEGYNRLTETLRWCSELGIRTVTVYAFSIDNFHRSKDEVDGLLDLARHKFDALLAERSFIDSHEVSVRVLGNLALLPDDLRATMERVVAYSARHTRMVLNVCFSYTSRDELTSAIRSACECVADGSLEPEAIDEAVLEQFLYTRGSAPPQIIVRTSGEIRLSNFLLWQAAYAHLAFMDVLWPEISFWHLFAMCLTFQRTQAPAIGSSPPEAKGKTD